MHKLKTNTMTLREKVINHYRTGNCDRYGQLPTVDIYSISNDKEEHEELRKLVNVNLYGGRFGTYYAFVSWGAFKDEELESECRAAFAQNPGRNNMNNW